MNALTVSFRKPLFLFLILLISSATWAQYFNQSTDLFRQDIARDLDVNPTDGSYVTTGYSKEGPVGVPPLTFTNLVKYDITGLLLWSRFYDLGTGFSRGNDVEKTSDGGYIIAGHGISPVTGIPSAILIKTDPVGTVIWSQFYDFSGPYSEAFAVEEVIRPLIGVTYAVTGSYRNPFNATLDIFAMSVDAGGFIISMSQFDTGLDEEGQSIKPGPGLFGGVGPAYIISGYSTFGAAAGRNVFVAGLTPLLGMIWGEVYGGPLDEEGHSLSLIPGGEILVSGYSNSFSNGRRDFFVSLLDFAGTPIWQNIYGRKKDEEAFSISTLSDGTFVTAGWTSQTSDGSVDAAYLKADFGGALLYSRNFGNRRNDTAYAIKESIGTSGLAAELLMGGVFGVLPAAASDDRDIYTIRTNSTGDSSCPKDPRFLRLPVTPVLTPCTLPAMFLAYSSPMLVLDPDAPHTVTDRCCTCSDMDVTFTVDPTIICAGTPVFFRNTSSCVDEFRWYVNGVLVPGSPDLNYVFATPGVYTITLYGRNAGCPVKSSSITISVSCGPTPRIEGPDQISEVQLSPNPANGPVELRVNLGEGADHTAFVKVADMTGRIVMEGAYPIAEGMLNVRLETAGWSQGIYLVQLRSGQVDLTRRLTINR